MASILFVGVFTLLSFHSLYRLIRWCVAITNKSLLFISSMMVVCDCLTGYLWFLYSYRFSLSLTLTHMLMPVSSYCLCTRTLKTHQPYIRTFSHQRWRRINDEEEDDQRNDDNNITNQSVPTQMHILDSMHKSWSNAWSGRMRKNKPPKRWKIDEQERNNWRVSNNT